MSEVNGRETATYQARSYGARLAVKRSDSLELYSNEDELRALRDLLDKILDEGTPELSLNELLVRAAIAHGQSVYFRYSAPNGPIQIRRLIPKELKDFSGNICLIGYDPDRDEPRSFRLDRIKGAVAVST